MRELMTVATQFRELRNMELTPIEHAWSVPPYQPGAPISAVTREFGFEPEDVVKLASNENPLGMSPLAAEQIARVAGDPARYPDADCYSLRNAISEVHGVTPERILVGAGLSEILVLLARAFLGPNRSSVFSQHAFTLYGNSARSVGANSIVVPAKNYEHDIDAMIGAVDSTTSMVLIGTPNNPTGTVVNPQDIERLLDSVPSRVLVVLDEAYREYLPPEEQPDSIAWLSRYPNLMVLRTFSKIYGLAGLRVGYAVAEQSIVDIVQRFRSPFSVSSLAQVAAEASLADTEFVERSYALNAAELAATSKAVGVAGFSYVPSRANFLLINVGDGTAVFRKMLRQGVIVRPMAGWGLPPFIRVTIGTNAEIRKFVWSLMYLGPVAA
jgi:histidinol-phosphate aminotransferase